ncbi:MAG: DUF2157 domain-containing protein [Bacteroidota bacterium]
MTKIDREDIQLISRHSNLSQKGIEKVLKEEIYSDQKNWRQFLKLIMISLGVGFTAFGILFFFAYNWADLHKFVKLGLIELIIVSMTIAILSLKLSKLTKNILLTGTVLIVGVLFAVFGQIYQTGANAYDFFLGWTLFVTLWVLVANFAPLWLVYITLINTTVILYNQQVLHSDVSVFLYTICFLINGVFLISFIAGNKLKSKIQAPGWYTKTLALTTVVFATLGNIVGIMDYNADGWFALLLILSASLYGYGIYYSLKQQSHFYLSIIAFSVIVIFCFVLIRISDGQGMFFLISIYVIASVTLVVRQMLKLQKKWKG